MPETKLKILLGLLGISALVTGAIAYWPAGSTIRVIAPRNSAARTLFQNRWWLRDAGIKEQIQFTHLNEVEAVRALALGSANIAILSVVPELFLPNAFEKDYVILDCLAAAEPVAGAGFNWLVGPPAGASSRPAEGITIALERATGSLERILSDEVLPERGVAMGGLRRLVMNPLEARRAFSIGNLDYAVLPEPVASLVVTDGSAIKLASLDDRATGVALYVIAAQKNFTLAEPTLSRKFRDILRKRAKNHSPPEGALDIGKSTSWPNQGLKSCAGEEPSRAALSAAMELFRKNGLFAGKRARLPQLF
jgi:hypothetical protein